MNQDKKLEAAKEGNPQAIAAMINKTLENKGISVKASGKHGSLTIVAESQTVPKQRAVVDFLKGGISKLNPENISQVIVCGRVTGQVKNAWQESFNLDSKEHTVTFTQPNVLDSDSTTVKPNYPTVPKIAYSPPRPNSIISGSSPLTKAVDSIKSKSLSSIQKFGWILFITGSGMLLIGLTYDPTVSSGMYDTERTYNIGKISDKSTYTNTGGFLTVCGAVFASCSRSGNEDKGSSS